MKSLFRASIFLGVFLFFIACGRAPQATPMPVSSPNAISVPTITPLPSRTATATLEATPTPAYVPPTLLPVIEPTLAQELLGKAFSIQFPERHNGHMLRQITGWDYGFRGCGAYDWLDPYHLVMFPTTGQKSSDNFGVIDERSSAVINVYSGKVWLPPYKLAWDCSNWMSWSFEFGFLALPSSNSTQEGVAIYTAEGEITDYYPGKLTSVAPSGTKVLIEDTWIDLKSGKMVDFEWYPDSDEYMYFPRALWSSDEMQVYTCCYKYGNARTGESFNFPYDHVSVEGKEVLDGLFHSSGSWVLNDSYLLIHWDFFYDTNPGFIPLFDPKARTLRNLNALANIPAESDNIPNCQMAFAAPDGRSVWATCYSGDYLIDLSTFTSVEYPMNNSFEYPDWSTSSNFAWLETEPPQILSVRNKTLSLLPVDPFLYSELSWHPTDDILAYLSEDGQKLELLNVQDMSIREVELPTTFKDFTWKPNGDYIALVSQDSRLWQVDYPTFNDFEQLTISFPQIYGVNWAPDGNSIAFLSGTDIYVVDTIK